MASSQQNQLIVSCRGGRNGFDPPHALPDGQVAEALNIDLYKGATMGRKRPGATADTMTFSSGGPFTGTISFLGRHVPGSDETAAELWAVDDATTPIVGRKAASTQYAAVTLKDAITGNAWEITGASLNGFYFLSYKSSGVITTTAASATSWNALSVAVLGAPVFDAATSGSFTSTSNTHTFSHTCGAGATELLVGVVGDATSDLITGVTYNAVAMTQLCKLTAGGVSWIYIYGLASPTAGAHNVVITASANCNIIGGEAISYTGTTGVFASTSSATASSATSVTTTLTPPVGSVAIQFSRNTLGSASGVVGGTLRVSETTDGLASIAEATLRDRLHVWDPVAGSVRRAGFATPGAPTVANTGAGAYAAVLRYYRVRWTEQQASVTVRRSEPGASTSFTPSGAGTAARVTQPTVAGEGETHWEVEASTDNVTFYLVTTVVIGTTFYDDSATTTSYASGTVSATTGTYTAQKSYKFLAVDQSRVLGFGSHYATDKQNTVEFSAVVGALNVSDAERVPTGNTVTLDENDSGVATGLVGPMNGVYYPFKYRQIWKLIPTGDPTTPYQPIAVSKRVGALSHQCIVIAEDENGAPALYFLSYNGPWRYGRNGLEYLANRGGNVLDLIQGPTSTINLSASHVVAHTVYHADLHQVWFHFATGSSADPDARIVWDVIAGAWVRHNGESAKARCAVMFANTQGSTMSRDLKPYIGYTGAVNKVWKCDNTSATDDGGTAFQAYITDKARAPWGFGRKGALAESILMAPAASGVTITQTLALDFGAQTANTSSALLTASGSETRVVVKCEASQGQEAAFVQATWGDASAVANSWQLDAVRLKWKDEGDL